MVSRLLVPILCRFVALFATTAAADQVDDFIKSEMAAHRIPGLALTILSNDLSLKTSAYGLANLELRVPVTPDTVFEIGSVTKQFTAAAILLLAQGGKLNPDDRISRYLSTTPEAWRNITIRHLLTHTSGLKSYTGLTGFELTRHLSEAEFIAAIASYPLEFDPGTSWKYSNTGFNLLGFIIQNVSGKGYWDFLGERILSPLGMTSTTNRSPALIIPNRAAGYEQTNHIWFNRDYDLTDVFSAGAMVSTIGDLAKWNVALDGDDLLQRKSKEAMWQPAVLNDGKSTQYGFGWRIENFEGHRDIGHGGSTSGFSATIQRFPDDKLAIIILSNTDEQIATSLARKLAQLFLK